MKVQLAKAFPLAASADAAWALLQDVEAAAGCMPGARITEKLDERRFKGTVAVRLGPASMAFRGEVEVKASDPAARRLHIVGRGTDSTGTSGASMDLVAHIEPVDGSSCKLVGASELSVSGKAATFGARMMGIVGDQVLQQFAASFAQRLAALQPQAAAAAAPAPPVPDLDGLALAWASLRAWLRGLFGPRRA